MRGLLTAAVLAAALATVAAPALAARHRAATPCAAKGSHTLAASRDARLYSVRVDPRHQRVADETGRLYGCWKASGRRRLLASSSDDQVYASSTFTPAVLAGRYAAWATESTDSACDKYSMCPPGYQPTTGFVRVVDLRSRRTVRTVRQVVTDGGLALTEHGAALVLSGTRLFAADRDGVRLLDTGTIAGRSLRAEISLVSWVRDGVERFARLR